MGLLFILALIGGCPLLALLIFGSMWLDASAKDDRERETRQFEIDESRHRDIMRRSYETEDALRSAVEDGIAASRKDGSGRKRRTRSVIKYTDGTVEGREVVEVGD